MFSFESELSSPPELLFDYISVSISESEHFIVNIREENSCLISFAVETISHDE